MPRLRPERRRDDGDAARHSRGRVVDARIDPGTAPFLPGTLADDGILALGGDVPPELLADGPGSHLDSCVIDSSSTDPANQLWISQKSRCDPRGTKFPRVLLGRGSRDEWYTAEKMRSDESALQARGVEVETVVFDGAHEWHADFAARAAAKVIWHGRA